MIQNRWGTTGMGTGAGAGVYFTYSAHHAAFGINQGNQIYDIRSFAPRVQSISRNEVLKALGSPGSILYAANTTIYRYPAGPDHQLLWVFDGGKGRTTDRTNHVDVYWLSGTVNLMAQNYPNPSIVVLTRSRGTRSDVRFVIKSAPPGFRLSEIAWVPENGVAPMVETYEQAYANRRLPHLAQGFVMHGVSGKLVYGASRHSQLGQIRVIYQNSAGTAIIGNSTSIRL